MCRPYGLVVMTSDMLSECPGLSPRLGFISFQHYFNTLKQFFFELIIVKFNINKNNIYFCALVKEMFYLHSKGLGFISNNKSFAILLSINWKTIIHNFIDSNTVDSRYSEVGYSEPLAIVNSFRPLVWFAIPDNVIVLTPDIVNLSL
jgi:hypothetical protein